MLERGTPFMKSRLFLLAIPFVALAVACGSGGDNKSGASTPKASPTVAAAKLDLSKDDLGR